VADTGGWGFHSLTTLANQCPGKAIAEFAAIMVRNGSFFGYNARRIQERPGFSFVCCWSRQLTALFVQQAEDALRRTRRHLR
jgi:hypothetical protein